MDTNPPHGLSRIAGPAHRGFATVVQVAEYLNVSKSKVYSMMEAGELAFIKLGALRRIPWQAVHDLVRRSTRGDGSISQRTDGKGSPPLKGSFLQIRTLAVDASANDLLQAASFFDDQLKSGLGKWRAIKR
jgi:excisionase family DNA binding protein